MDKIARNQLYFCRKYILTTLLFWFLFAVVFYVDLWKWNPDETPIKQAEKIVTFENVVLSQRGISSRSISSNLGHIDIVEVEAIRRKNIRNFGVLATNKPGLPGFVNVHMWLELCGTDLLTLKYFPLFPNIPSTRQLWPGLDIAQLGFNYGKRVFGYLSAPTSGNYFFRWKASGSSEFWLSTGEKPHHSRCIFCMEKERTAFSEVSEVYLHNSQWYYFEILHKHGQYQWNDYILLEWKTGESDFTTIPTKYLKSYQDDREIGENVVNIDSFAQPGLKMHHKPPIKTTDTFEKYVITRETIYKLPFISADLIKDLFPFCSYKPDYLVNHKLSRYKSQWENIYTAIYPSDDSNLVDVYGVIRFGNDVLEADVALKIVKMVMDQFKVKKLTQFGLENILNVEEKRGRYLVELQLLDENTKKSVRFSEYVYLSKNSGSLCYPEGFKWNKSSMVNFIVTSGRNQGRWVYHFIQNMEKIYKETKDRNFNVIINDFLCPDADLRRALEKSSLPNYVYLANPGAFHKTLGLQQAAAAVKDGIVAVVDLHLDIPAYYIDDIRKHSIKGVQYYSPVLQRYDCGANAAAKMGSFWEIYGYGLVGIYKDDWVKFGGMNVEEFKNKWGGEDVEMADRLLSAGYEGERKKAKNLVHYFHTKNGMWNVKSR